jgi:hypothetical protein
MRASLAGAKNNCVYPASQKAVCTEHTKNVNDPFIYMVRVCVCNCNGNVTVIHIILYTNIPVTFNPRRGSKAILDNLYLNL